MNNKDLINYFACISDLTSNPIDEFESLYNDLKSKFSEIEFTLYLKLLITDLNIKIIDTENYLNTSLALGSPIKTYSIVFENDRFERDFKNVLKIWKLSLAFFEHKISTPEKPEIELNFDKMNDYLTPNDLKTLMGWTKTTVATKHSRGELACVEGTGLTPKEGLKVYLEKKTKGLIDAPEKWFAKNIQKKGK